MEGIGKENVENNHTKWIESLTKPSPFEQETSR